MPNIKVDPKKSSKNSYMMSFRMDKDTYHKLNMISKANNINKSELLRNSFNEWITLKKVLITSDTMIVGKNVLNSLFNFADEKEIIDLGKKIAEIWVNEFNIHLIDMQAKEDLDSMLTTFTEGIGPDEANWFDKINYQRKDNGMILIYGIHSLNKKFSLFFKSFLEHLMAEEFKFILIHNTSNISDTTIRLEFKLADNK